MAQRSAFTIVELLIFSAIFAVASVAFLTILVSVTRVQVRQTAVAEVNQQSQFLLQTLQRYVEQSSLIELAADAATSTLKLRMASSTIDPTTIYASGTTMYVRETDSGAPQALTSDKVKVSSIAFTKRENAGGRDSVSIVFTMEFNAANIQHAFSQALNFAVARVSAATFDSNIIPTSANTYKLGVSAGDWQSINNTIFFSSSNVGVGVTPNAKFQVTSGDVYVDTTTKGVILRSPDGTCYRVTVANGGALSTASLTCP